MQLPKIAITLGASEKPSDKEYRDAVLNAGGDPVLLRPNFTQNLGLAFDGLLLSGGEDVNPELYHEKKEPFCDAADQERDKLEVTLLNKFLSENKPVLAICRGIQLLNVAAGGTLYQDMEQQLKHDLHTSHKNQNHLSREEKRAFRHLVKIKEGSLLRAYFGSEKEVNSRHHQSIKTTSPLLEVTAISHDGIIEAVESKKYLWVVGVQWHPEADEVYPAFIQLFKGFISACIERLSHAPAPFRTKPGTHNSSSHRTGAEASL